MGASSSRTNEPHASQNEVLTLPFGLHVNNNDGSNGMKKVGPYKQKYCVLKDSLKLARKSPDSDEYFLNFSYSSTVVVLITVYVMAKENRDFITGRTEFFSIEGNFPKPRCFKSPSGTELPIKENAVSIQTSLYEGTKVFKEERDKTYPIVITMQEESQPQKDMLLYYILLQGADEHLSGAKVLRQKLQTPEKCYEVEDIYKPEAETSNRTSSNLENDVTSTSTISCIICYSEKADVILFPCRHLCLCPQCAGKIRENVTKNCPICRKCNNI